MRAMSTGSVAAIGATHELEGFALVGATVIAAATPSQATEAWRTLDENVGLVILSPAAAEMLDSFLSERPHTLTVVMP